MNKLKVALKNCYGIQSLDHEFDFSVGTPEKPKARAYAIYAPNGSMKTSFSKTFEALAKGDVPKEERFNRAPIYTVEADGVKLSEQVIYVLKADVDIDRESRAMTDILVNPAHKRRYDELIFDLDKQKNKLINSLKNISKIKADDIEKTLLKDCGMVSLHDAIEKCVALHVTDDLAPFEYKAIFDPKVVEILNSPEFVQRAREFNIQYQELFEKAGTIYRKGVFNPAKAETSISTLDRQGYFESGHRVHFKGEANSFDRAEVTSKLQRINASIESDVTLKKLRVILAKNAQTQALTDLIESLSSAQIDFLLEKVKPENQEKFRIEIWAFFVNKTDDARIYLELFGFCKDEMIFIENEAAKAVPQWIKAVELFNDRFLDMPFTLSVANLMQTALGKEDARLTFTFREGDDSVNMSRSEIKNLSLGERRALYILNFIFEVEKRKIMSQKTLFVIDDAADSFDYKNKHAIVQYLKDLAENSAFYQNVLTHNYDFFRSIASSFVHRSRCLMTNRSANLISFEPADGINNYFIGKWKSRILTSKSILCATIPFTRNLIEYTKGEKDPDYIVLTSLLHWKIDTEKITVGGYFDIYNRLFGTNYECCDSQLVTNLMFAEAQVICSRASHDGLNLEDKVLLSIAIRLRSEMLLIKKIRAKKNDADYWFSKPNQFGNLMKEFASLVPNAPELRTLEKVSITVSSNIHLNSFMYEPILDLTIEHLISLYNEVVGL